MSISATILIEFHNPPTVQEQNALRQSLAARLFCFKGFDARQLWVQHPADPVYTKAGYSGYSVGDGGTLHQDADPYSPPVGCAYQVKTGAIGGISCLGRWWSPDHPEGAYPLYATLLLTLLHSPLVKGCWYYPETASFPAPVPFSRDQVLTWFDHFIGAGA